MSSEHLEGVDQVPIWARAAVELIAHAAGAQADRQILLELDDASTRILRDRKIDGIFYSLISPEHPATRIYEKAWARQKVWLAKVNESFTRAHIRYLVFKGAEFVERYLGSRTPSLLSDFDLLVSRPSVINALKEVYGLGFRPAVFDTGTAQLIDRDIVEIAQSECEHYELAPMYVVEPLSLDNEELAFAADWKRDPLWVVQGQAYLLIKVDIHHGISTDIDGQPFLDRAVDSAFSGMATMSLADHLWFTTSRFYTEVALHSKTSLRDFVYLAAAVRDRAIDWDAIVTACAEFELHSSLFYFLSFLRETCRATVPSDVLRLLNPRNGRRQRDWGWQLGRLFDVIEPSPFITKIRTF